MQQFQTQQRLRMQQSQPQSKQKTAKFAPQPTPHPKRAAVTSGQPDSRVSCLAHAPSFVFRTCSSTHASHTHSPSRASSAAPSRALSKQSSLLGDSQFVHPPRSHQSSTRTSVHGEIETDLERDHAPAELHSLQHPPGLPANKRAHEVAPSGAASVRPVSTHLPLTAREVRAIVRSEVLGSAAELRSTYSYLPPPPKPIQLTRTQMLQQAARDASNRARRGPSDPSRLSQRAAPIAGLVAQNVEDMLQEQVRRRADGWTQQQQQQERGGEEELHVNKDSAQKDEEKEKKKDSSPRSSVTRTQQRQLERALQHPSRVNQPSFSPPKLMGTLHSPPRSYASQAEAAAAAAGPALRWLDRAGVDAYNRADQSLLLLERMSADTPIHTHLQQLWSDAKMKLGAAAAARQPSNAHGAVSDVAHSPSATGALAAAAASPQSSPANRSTSSTSLSPVSSVASERSHGGGETRDGRTQLHDFSLSAEHADLLHHLSTVPIVCEVDGSADAGSDQQPQQHIELRPVAIVVAPDVITPMHSSQA